MASSSKQHTGVKRKQGDDLVAERPSKSSKQATASEILADAARRGSAAAEEFGRVHLKVVRLEREEKALVAELLALGWTPEEVEYAANGGVHGSAKPKRVPREVAPPKVPGTSSEENGLEEGGEKPKHTAKAGAEVDQSSEQPGSE